MGKVEVQGDQEKKGAGEQMAVPNNWTADVKFFVTALLFLCSLATVLQFLPSRLSFSLPRLPSPPSSSPDCPTDPSRLLLNHTLSPLPLNQTYRYSGDRHADGSVIIPPRQQNRYLPLQQQNEEAENGADGLPRQQSYGNKLTSTPRERNGAVEDGVTNPSVPRQRDEVTGDGTVRRRFDPYGAAAYAFVLMSAYRGGPGTFVVNGLASKPLHVFGKPSYRCRWVGEDRGGGRRGDEVVTEGVRYLPDWGYGRVYTVVVVNCTFPVAVGVEGGGGGRLVVEAMTNGGGDRKVNVTDTIEALYEAPGNYEMGGLVSIVFGYGRVCPCGERNGYCRRLFSEALGSVNFSYFTSPPKYDYLYCGSPLYGDLSPQRVREWIAYHVRFFGEKSHFIIHDAGGVHADVLAVLRPWIEKGYVTLNDVREQERFDGYYHNQFLIVNDCLHRYRFDAKWVFFFDVDEFIFVPKKKTIKSVTDSLLDYTQFTIQQMPMSGKLCLDDGGRTYKKWGFEKLAYRDSRTRIRRDRKYAVQPRNVLATGVHMSENIVGKTMHKTEGQIKYYHYHGTIAQRREPCRQLVNTTGIPLEGIPYVVDTTMRDIGATVKRFELKMIGPILQKTRQ